MAGRSWWRPFAALRRRRARADAALAALEAGAAAAEAQAARLAEAVAVAHHALAMLGDLLTLLARQPASVDAAIGEALSQSDALAEHARASLDRAATAIATHAADRVAEEIAPARAAAELHAQVMRASLDRLRGEATALAGAEDAAHALVALSGTVQTGLSDTLAALARRAEASADAADRAVARIAAAADRLDPFAPTRRPRPRPHLASE